MATFAKMVQESPSLRQREREIGDRMEAALAATLAAESGAAPTDVTPRVVAGQIAAVFRVLHREARQMSLAGERAPAIAPVILRMARAAFDSLESGVGNYCT